MPKIFIDGQAGTTGLRIRQRLAQRQDIELMTLSDDVRKDTAARQAALQGADIAFLCLPDDAAREAVALAAGSGVKIIDASTAHRTNPDWAYGFPELSQAHREKIAGSSRVAVPGCYASGFISLVYPLVAGGLIGADYPVISYAVSGYSGGGKRMIEAVEAADCPPEAHSPRFYGLANTHKHLPEMQKISGLTCKPMFTPIVDDFYNGMVVCVPLLRRLEKNLPTAAQVQAALAAHYAGAHFVRVKPLMPHDEMAAYKLSSNDLRDTNLLEIFVFGDDEQMLLCARLDNLGKGASGAAVQCMNIMLGLDETLGL